MSIVQPANVTVKNSRFRIEQEYDPSVRVPDFVLKCVGFVSEVTHRDSLGIDGDLYATGFFVSVTSRSSNLRAMGSSYVYFVTAKHIANDLRGREVYFLVNRKSGGTLKIEKKNEWYFHPTDATADVAVVQIGPEPEADIVSVHAVQLGTPDILKAQDVGIGDEVFATGLFTPAPGTARNVPILRHGNIAMMPGEQIQTELGFADVYLVEARSIGGLSGSPVFVRPTIHAGFLDESGKKVDFVASGHGITLIGLMQGHWDIKESDLNKASISNDPKRGVNMGVCVVVPAAKILETLNRRELVTLREQDERLFERSNIPTADSKRHADANNEHPFAQADFEEALRMSSRRKQ